MKIYNIEIKDSVHNFLWELWEYLFMQSFSFQTSKRVIDEIYKEIFSLKIFPYRYESFNEKYRVLTVGKKYRIFYYVDENTNTVIVSQIFSSYQDYNNYIF